MEVYLIESVEVDGQSPKDTPERVKNPFSDHINDEKKLSRPLASPKENPQDNYTKLMDARSKLMYIAANAHNDDLQREANIAWQIITDVSFLAKQPLASPLSDELAAALKDFLLRKIKNTRLRIKRFNREGMDATANFEQGKLMALKQTKAALAKYQQAKQP